MTTEQDKHLRRKQWTGVLIAAFVVIVVFLCMIAYMSSYVYSR